MVAGKRNDTWWGRGRTVCVSTERCWRAGVEIYEFQPTMLHQKAMLVDGVWATVSTANF
jgi:cardiolipin synthase A/B